MQIATSRISQNTDGELLVLIFRVTGDSRIGESKPSPFENREGAGTRKFKFKGWPTRQSMGAGHSTAVQVNSSDGVLWQFAESGDRSPYGGDRSRCDHF